MLDLIAAEDQEIQRLNRLIGKKKKKKKKAGDADDDDGLGFDSDESDDFLSSVLGDLTTYETGAHFNMFRPPLIHSRAHLVRVCNEQHALVPGTRIISGAL